MSDPDRFPTFPLVALALVALVALVLLLTSSSGSTSPADGEGSLGLGEWPALVPDLTETE